MHEWINKILAVPIYYLVKPQPREQAWQNWRGEKILLRLSLTLVDIWLDLLKREKKNHSTQGSHVVPHHGTNWAALWLTSQIRRDAVVSKSYGRG